jgi:hypothetical protein
MKQSILFFLATAALILASCGDGRSDAAKQMAAVADSARKASQVDLADHHLPLVLRMPAGLPAPSLVWKDEVGKLEVRAGDHFALEISEAPGGMDRLKADLDRDLLKKNTILSETPDLLIYRSEFPDDTTLVFHHFRRVITVEGRTFVVEDREDGTAFSLAETEQMAKAVQPREPA